VIKGQPRLPATGIDAALLLLMALAFIGFGTAATKRN
jgi:LPXTG-motif cell wall-anchored protein